MIQDQFKKGKNPTSLLALQQIADFMTTNMPSMYPAAPQGGMAALNMSLGMVTPVNDLRGSDSIAYEKGEKLLRCKLAAFYRLTDLFSWSQLIYNHLTCPLKKLFRKSSYMNRHGCHEPINVGLGMVTPVNDLRGSDSIAYEKGEKLLRCKLAAFYRLTDLFSWSQLIYNHLTV
ncbi:UNVERIFIED_CONTAM: hypothetical protein FKN15_056877 [Acipenser sinensis]